MRIRLIINKKQYDKYNNAIKSSSEEPTFKMPPAGKCLTFPVAAGENIDHYIEFELFNLDNFLDYIYCNNNLQYKKLKEIFKNQRGTNEEKALD